MTRRCNFCEMLFIELSSLTLRAAVSDTLRIVHRVRRPQQLHSYRRYATSNGGTYSTAGIGELYLIKAAR
jgi:hypothetical protein